MKGIGKFIGVLIAFALVCTVSPKLYADDQPATAAPAATAVASAPPAVTGSVAMGTLNRYIFRGYELSSHSVVFQPSLTLNYLGFTANLFSNIDSNEHETQSFTPVLTGRGRNHFDEADLTLSYTYTIDKLALTGGFLYYGTQYAPETEELFVSGTYDMIAHPALAINRDICHYPGTYFNLSFSQSIPVYKDTTVDLATSFGYEAGSSSYWDTYNSATGLYNGPKYSAFHDGMVKVGYTIPVTKILSVQPVAQYWFPLSSDAGKTVDDKSYNHNGHIDDTFVYGLNMTFSF